MYFKHVSKHVSHELAVAQHMVWAHAWCHAWLDDLHPAVARVAGLTLSS
jgi:hypothetical protein